jgi:alpha-L-rhamnosidase
VDFAFLTNMLNLIACDPMGSKPHHVETRASFNNFKERTMLTPYDLTCEYFTNPIGLDVRQPQLSWKSRSEQRGALQSAYQIRVARDHPASSIVWDSGKIISDASLHIAYAGLPLEPNQRCTWQVRVWDENDEASNWSETASWEMGLMDPANWQADWITPGWEEDADQSQPAPFLRRSFSVTQDVLSARIYAASLGLYELHLNGNRVGDFYLTPGWTSYDHRILYQTYDVTAMLHEGGNVLGAILGDGWYRGFMGFQGQRNLYGKRLALLLQLEITTFDGNKQIITSDEQWRAARGPILASDIYMGETYDARLEMPGWDTAGFNDSEWSPVRIHEHTKATVVAQDGPPIRKHERIKPVRLLHSPKGETILDFGQNMVGWVQARAQGPAGATMIIRHAEVLDQDGNLYTENLRSARQTAQYTLRGAGQAEVFEPHFTFMGFQYIAVEGYPGEPTLDDFTGVVIHTDTPPTGAFECSNALINQLQHNIIWGQKGNFVDVPTDCPQRDERLGWTGDTQVFIRTACFNMHVGGFFTKWLRDLRADQLPNGSVPFVIPDALRRGSEASGGFPGAGSAAWGDAATICPWTIYQCYGDQRLLAEQYPSMKAWVDFIHGQADADFIWRSGFHFGDWLDARGESPLVPNPVTNTELISTAFFAYSAELTARAAGALGNTSEADAYAKLAANVKEAFAREFLTPSGRVGPNTQTAYVLALHFDLLPAEARPAAAVRLADEVRKANYHLTTGFVGASYLPHALSRFGYTDVAYELLNQESYPSWLYPVKKGATTIWERWDGIKPDGSFQDAGMNSFNHYAYGAIGEWLYRTVAGIEIDPAAPGYKHVWIQPSPGGGLTSVRAALETPFGRVESAWKLTEAGFQLEARIPANARATVRLPAASIDEVRESGQALAVGNGILSAWVGDSQEGDGGIFVEVGAGSYTFYTTGLTLAKALEGVRHIAGRLDRYSSLGDLLENEAAKEVLVEQLGDAFLQTPMLWRVLGTPLAELNRFAPHLLTEAKLDAIEKGLLALSG